MFSIFLRRLVAHTKIREYLDREHPHLLTEKYGWLYLTAAALFIALSINHQQPHGLHDWHHPYKWSILSGFGLIPMTVFVAIYELLPRIFPHRFAKTNWTCQKEITAQAVFFISAATVNWGFAIMEIPYFRASVSSFFHFQFYSLEYGIPPITSISLLMGIKHTNRISKQAREDRTYLLQQAPTSSLTEIPFSYSKLHFDLNNVVYINKYVNSLQFHLSHEDGCEVVECIGTIKDMLLQLEEYPQLPQTHQTFLVNTHWIKGLKGNSNAMEITLKNCPDKVQVSRKFVERVKKALVPE